MMIEEQERPAALARIREGQEKGRENQQGLVCAESAQTKRRQSVPEIAAQAVGLSRQTYERAKAVVQAAQDDLEKFGNWYGYARDNNGTVPKKVR